MVDLFGEPVFTKMILKLKAYTPQLIALVVAMLKSTEPAELALQHFRARDPESQIGEEAFDQFGFKLDRVKKILRFFGCLLNVQGQGFDSEPFSTSDVVYLMGYKGKDSTEKILLEAVNLTPAAVALCDEVVRTATSSVRLRPEKDRLQQSLKALTIASESVVRVDKLADMNEMLPRLHKGIRQCDMEPLNEVVIDLLMKLTNSLLEGDPTKVSSRYAGEIQKGLIFFQTTGVPGMADLNERLQLWMTTHQRDTALMDLLDLAQQCDDVDRADLAAVEKLMSRLQKTKIEADRLDLQWAALRVLVSTLRTMIWEARPCQDST